MKKELLRTTICIYILSMSLFSCKREEKSNINIKGSFITMSKIPAGSFLMGAKTKDADQDELPRHPVEVSSFWMDQTEVTNAEFSVFVRQTGYVTIAERDIKWEDIQSQLPPNTPKIADSLLRAGSLVFKATDGPVNLQDYSQWWSWTIGADWLHPDGPESNIDQIMNHPVVHIAWDDAIAYCQWAKKRLPTEAEWEWASMGGLDDSIYPWGNESAEKAFNKANFWQGMFPFQNQELDGFYKTAPVRTFPANGYGLYDMAGNVWEWCSDKYHSDAYQMESEKTNPRGPLQSFDPAEPYAEKYVIRGGSFLCNDSYCSGYRVSRRMRSTRDSGFNHTGFRCVKDIE